jgi:hypothetical protein
MQGKDLALAHRQPPQRGAQGRVNKRVAGLSLHDVPLRGNPDGDLMARWNRRPESTAIRSAIRLTHASGSS